MLTYEEVAKRLQDRKISTVAEATGLSYYTVRRVKKQEAEHVSYNVIKKISDYLIENK